MQFEADVALADFQSVIGSPYEQFQALPSAIQGKYIQAYPKLIWKIFGVPPKIKTAMRSAFECIYKGLREVEQTSDVVEEMRQSNAIMGLGDVRDRMRSAAGQVQQVRHSFELHLSDDSQFS